MNQPQLDQILVEQRQPQVTEMRVIDYTMHPNRLNRPQRSVCNLQQQPPQYPLVPNDFRPTQIPIQMKQLIKVDSALLLINALLFNTIEQDDERDLETPMKPPNNSNPMSNIGLGKQLPIYNARGEIIGYTMNNFQ